ncbi:MAG: efflux RND transporter permease subunit [Bacteroidia bacterium]|nr:efflux RND transporter permease subunit [Bacteroidia bacterium]
MKNPFKESPISSWAIDNKTAVYVLTTILVFMGVSAYNKLPKENFPDIVVPTVYISTIYPGTSPADIENLVTRPIEKQLKGINGVKKITSNSIQDFSSVSIEFNTNIDVQVAKQRVKDAVDKAKSDLPNNLPRDPNVVEVNFADFPIMFVNVSGTMDLDKLKKYAEDMKEKMEGLKEITRVDLVGALEREIQINVDMYKAEAAEISIGDIENAVKYENMTISGGNVNTGDMKRNIRIIGQFTDVSQINNLIIRTPTGQAIYLKDIAQVIDSHKEKESFARLDHNNVITLNIVKRSGQNLINASDNVRAIEAKMRASGELPANLKVTFTGDQSNKTRTTLEDLINTIIIGFALVVIILMFFMGVTNAVFVAASVPLSMFIAFLIMPSIGFSLNMIVLFSFLFALGIVVDDAIVVIENTHRIFDNGKVPILQAAKMACGEVFLPVLSGTLTTIAPFLPLAFWPGIIGKFMFFLPITLMITLFASLLVAYIINPVFAVDFMKPHTHHDNSKVAKAKALRKLFKNVAITIGVGLLCYIIYFLKYKGIGHGNVNVKMYVNIGEQKGNGSGWILIGNLLFAFAAVQVLFHFVVNKAIAKFQATFIPALMSRYEKILHWTLKGMHPTLLLVGTFVLLILSVMLVGKRNGGIVFFPKGDPNFIYTYVIMPVGTEQNVTDSVARVVEKKIYSIIGEHNPLVESVITNVTIGARDPSDPDQSPAPHRAKIGVAFVPFGQRNGASTRDYLDKIRAEVKALAGVQVIVDQEQSGPPTGKAINVELSGDNLEELIATSKELKQYIDAKNIKGIEELKSDFVDVLPQLVVDINRERLQREGLSTAQVGMAIRNAVYGNEASKFRENEDEYKIMIRYNKEQRSSIDKLMQTKITYRDMAMMGRIRQLPLSAIATFHYDNSYGGIKRINSKRVINLQSNALTGSNPNEIVGKINKALPAFKASNGIEIKMTGEQEQQAETSNFLGGAMMMSIGLIFFILVLQFNGISKPVIIILEILFSVTGVLLGIGIFKMQMVIVMTGMGIVALAGIVVRNGILVVEFIDVLLERGDIEHGNGKKLKTINAIILGGKTRITPVLLTTSATILGLIPLAIGLNVNFEGLIEHLQPHFFLGGDNVAFWGPLAWTMIFGLSFGTILTLILVPSMYLIIYKLKLNFNRWKHRRSLAK